MPNIYTKYILPRVTDKICALKPTMKQREKIIPLARGKILEVGVGSGLNFPYYNSQAVEYLLALDPSREMISLAKRHLEKLSIEVKFVQAMAEDIPLDNNTVDQIVITYSLCTIKDYHSALDEFRRVLKPGGQLIFCEHGLAPDKEVRRWQHILNPVWKPFSGGCHLNRDIPAMITDGGFKMVNIETMYIPGFKPACYNFWGVAKGR